jgi:hypothetical protein
MCKGVELLRLMVLAAALAGLLGWAWSTDKPSPAYP